MNRGKVGRPYTLTDRYIKFLAVVRYLFIMPYRQLEGFTRSLNRLALRFPPVDYSVLRKRILKLDLLQYEELKGSREPIVIAMDSTGVKVHQAGGWVEREHGKKKRYVKIHFAVNVETKEVVAMEVTTDDTHDSKVFPRLLKKAERRGRVSKVYVDGAFDSSEVYEMLRSKEIEAIIKSRKNSRLARALNKGEWKENSYRSYHHNYFNKE